jgi:hypothetical protein
MTDDKNTLAARVKTGYQKILNDIYRINKQGKTYEIAD